MVVTLALPNQLAWSTTTDGFGNAQISIADDVARGLEAGDVASIYVDGQLVTRVTLMPLIAAAEERARPVEPAPPPLPSPAPVEPPVPPPASESTRAWQPGEIALLTAALCAVKLWSVDQCEEKLNESFGLGSAGGALCAVGAELLQGDEIDAKTFGEALTESKLSKQNDLLQTLLALKDLATCFFAVRPQLEEAASSGKLPPLPN